MIMARNADLVKRFIPYDGFPLFVHVDKARPPEEWRYAKQIRGRRHYFGRVADGWEPALAAYERERHYLHTGRRRPNDGITVGAVCNRWAGAKLDDHRAGAIVAQTLTGYCAVAEFVALTLGPSTAVATLGPAAFEELRAAGRERWKSIARQTVLVTVTKMIFSWAYESELIKAEPRYGKRFVPPQRRLRRREKRAKGPKLFSATEIVRMLELARPPLTAMIWLGVNGGFQNSEVASLRFDELDLDAGVVDTYRAKTEVRRYVPLWPETVAALRVAMRRRPQARVEAEAEFDDLVFLTERRRPFLRREATIGDGVKLSNTDAVASQFNKIRAAAGIKRQGCGFATFRHVFSTVADNTAHDEHAKRLILGQAVPGISEHYVEEIWRERAVTVSEHVRRWLLAARPGPAPANVGQ
jgi:integrase